MNRYLLIGLVLIGASLALGRQEETPAPGAPEATPVPNATPFPNGAPQVLPAQPAPEAEGPDVMPPGTNDLAEPPEPGQGNGPSEAGSDARSSGGAQGSSRRRDGRESRNRRLERERQRARSQGGAGAGSGSATNALPSLDYAAFKVINDLNIFDPNRRPSGPPPVREPPSEYFGLVGTMRYEKGTFAFFSGSSSRYEKVLKISDSIAGYKVVDIDANSVKLTAPTAASTLADTEGASALAGTNGAAGLAGTKGVAALAGTNRASALASTNGASALASTNRASALASTNRASALARTNGASALAGTNGVAALAKTPAPPHELVMRMGMQLRRRGDDPWRLSEGSSEETSSFSSRSSSNSPSSGASSSGSEPSSPASGGGESDIIKRLMQRRDKE